MTTDEQKRELEARIRQELQRVSSCPPEQKTPVDVLYYDLAVSFSEGDVMEYRMLCIHMTERCVKFYRHGKIREEFPFTSSNTVAVSQSSSGAKIRVAVCEQSNVVLLTQTESDFNAVFEALRRVTTDNNAVLYQEDFLQDVRPRGR